MIFFEHLHDAAMAGMRDGLTDAPLRHPINFNSRYELGYILGAWERRQRREDNMKRGALVHYRSLAGCVFDGVLTCDVRQDGTVAIDVNVPGCREDPLSLNKVRWSDGPSTYARTAWPRAT